MPRLFALDENFPEPIVDMLAPFLVEAELVPLDRIDPRLPEMDDWELLLALHHHGREWDGLITTDSSMLKQPRERQSAQSKCPRLQEIPPRKTLHIPRIYYGRFPF